MAMADRARRTISAYRVGLFAASRDKRILVEGKMDQNFMARLKDRLVQSGRLSGRIYIDTADNLDSPDGEKVGNREKVEKVCEGLGADVAGRFVGFVDREYRRFDLIGDTITDEIDSHLVNGFLIWSRGHSIENYLFDFRALSHAIECSTESHQYRSALRRLQPVYQEVLRLACAIGLAAHNANRLEAIRSCIRWQDLCLSPNPHLDESAWVSHLAEKHPKLDGPALYAAIEEWRSRLATCTDSLICWLCDGHIGLAVSLAAYQRALFDVTNDSTEAENALGKRREHCALGGALKWAELAANGDTIWPSEIEAMLTA